MNVNNTRELERLREKMAELERGIERQYYLLGKTVCQESEEYIERINDLTDLIVKMKKEEKKAERRLKELQSDKMRR